MAKETPDLSEGTSHEQAIEVTEKTLERFFATADVTKVYGRPQKYGEIAVIPAAEVLVGMGFGFGSGAGGGTSEEGEPAQGAAGGGAGGGRTLARPVAVVIASPEGVRVEPVRDPTKVLMAAITAGGFVGAMLFRMRRGKFSLRG